MPVLRDDIRLDIGDTIGFPAQTAISVSAPADLAPGASPLVVFAFPGVGYGRGYYDLSREGYSQAAFHVARGAVFVACDHLAVGDSSDLEPEAATLETLAAANQATTELVTERLRAGTLLDGVPPIDVARRVGIGQSGGGLFLTVQQGAHATFDAVALLGWSGHETIVPFPQSYTGAHRGNVPRAVGAGEITMPELVRYAFHFDDVDSELLAADAERSPVPPWASLRVPIGPALLAAQEPGVATPWASQIAVPVLIGVGERDVCPDPRREPAAYPRSQDITVVVVPRMAHMHNFASTRERLWRRLEGWFATV